MHVLRFLSVICAVLLVPGPSLAQTADRPGKFSPKHLTKELQGLNADIFYGGTMIASGQMLRGPIVVIDGSIDIQDGGVLEGDTWVVNGSLVITGSGRLTGRVVLVNSEMYLSHSGTVTGGATYYTCECRIDAKTYEEDGELTFVKEEDPMAIKTKFAWGIGKPTRVRYNVARVGLRHGNKLRRDPHTRWEAMIDIPLYADTQHGFLQFDVNAQCPLGSNRYKILAGGYKTLHTEDSWQVSRTENALLLFLTSNEFANYYEKRGAFLGLEWQLHPFVKVDAMGFFQQDVSMIKSRVLTLFGNKDNLPPNPPIDQGARGALRLGFVFDSREDRDYPQNAWYLGCSLEPGRLVTDAAGDADLNYTAFTIEANRYTRLPFGLQWDIGTRLSSSFTQIPTQLSQTLNGYGGIRGTDDAPFPVVRGDRMVRLSTEFRVGLPDAPVVRWFYTQWDLLVFADAGYLTEATNPTSTFGWLDTSFRNWKKSVGVGVSGESIGPYVGLYVSREIDGDRDRPRFIVRLERSF